MQDNDQTKHGIDGLIRLREVLDLIPVSKSTWWVGVKAGRFPQPYKVGPRTTVWRSSDISSFINSISSSDVEGDQHE